ncbi:serine hydrolase domain-containing protein [Actinomadura litoris]|nr:serine hydrolase domain-containing protein [Actinomadura litoris]
MSRIPALFTAALGAALAVTAVVPAANAAPKPKVQAAADDLVASGVPGVNIMMRRGGHVSYVTSGVSDKATGAPMDHRLMFRAASLTKSFTSTVVLQLAAEHRLSLDDTVEKWLPGVVQGNGNDGSKITLRQLLAQKTGLNDYTRDPRLLQDPKRTWTKPELIAMAMEQPPKYEPGEDWNYSNTNYILADMVVEKATGRTLGTELKRRIFNPLKLRHTSFPTSSRAFPGPYIHGYWGKYGDVSTEVSPSSGRGSGGLISTVDDLARFHRALFTGRILPARQMRELTTTRPVMDEWIVEDYGLGVARTRFSCGYGWGHDGGFPGYRTWAYTSADGRRQAVITYNETEGEEGNPAFQAKIKKAAETAFCS